MKRWISGSFAVLLAAGLLLGGCGNDRALIESKPLYRDTHPAPVASETVQESALPAEKPALTPEETLMLEAYQTMFRHIYDVDQGLNSGITKIAVDTAKMQNLTDGIKDALLSALAEDSGCEIIEGDYESLLDAGILTRPAGQEEMGVYFTDGIIVTIHDEPREGDTLRFDVEKWRGPLGAYYFSDCVLTLEKDGWIITDAGWESAA